NKLEPIIEQYNQVHAQLQDTQAKIDGLQQQMAPLQMQVDLAMTRVGAVSAQLYEMGPGSRMVALLQAGSPAAFADQLTSLVGKPYIWGAAGPTGYDCSGLTLVAWASVGVTLGHYTGWQWSEANPSPAPSYAPETWCSGSPTCTTWASTSAAAGRCTRHTP